MLCQTLIRNLKILFSAIKYFGIEVIDGDELNLPLILFKNCWIPETGGTSRIKLMRHQMDVPSLRDNTYGELLVDAQAVSVHKRGENRIA